MTLKLLPFSQNSPTGSLARKTTILGLPVHGYELSRKSKKAHNKYCFCDEARLNLYFNRCSIKHCST